MSVARGVAGLALLAGLTACIPAPQVAPGPPTKSPPPGHSIAPPAPMEVPASLFALHGELTQGALVWGVAPKNTALLLLDGEPVRFDPDDGRFIIGFGRDAGPRSMLEARLADGRLLRLPLAIAPREWDISRLPISRGTGPSAAFLRKREPELKLINAAKSADEQSDGWREQFRWPAVGRISTLFGSQRIYADGPGAYHGGIDIARPEGSIVLAPADGVVVLATDHPFTLEGNLVMIDHGMGLVSAIMHLSKIEVHEGERVTRGQEIGLSGMTGRATGPHVHWGLTWHGARLDPLLVAGPMPVEAAAR